MKSKITRMKYLACTVLTSFLALTGYGNSASEPPAPSNNKVTANSASAQAAPAWELRRVAGGLVKSRDFDGKVVILNFWASWCPPCREEIPGLVELWKQYGDKGLVVVGVSLDEGGTERVEAFIKQFEINYPVVMGTPEVVAAFGGIESIPTTFILDRHGKIVSKHVGYVPKSTFAEGIKILLEKTEL